MAFIVDITSASRSRWCTEPKPAEELAGLVYSETPKEDLMDPKEASLPVVPPDRPARRVALVMVIALNLVF